MDEENCIVEMKVPQSWIGKSLSQLDLRKLYSINVLGKRDPKTHKLEVPVDPSAPIEMNDTFLVSVPLSFKLFDVSFFTVVGISTLPFASVIFCSPSIFSFIRALSSSLISLFILIFYNHAINITEINPCTYSFCFIYNSIDLSVFYIFVVTYKVNLIVINFVNSFYNVSIF